MSNRKRKIVTVAGLIGIGAMLAALLLPQAFAGERVTFKGRVYQLTYKVPGASPMTVYASLGTGSWREDMRDEVRISSGRSYEIIDRETGSVYHRLGSPRFMGFLENSPPAVVALRGYLAGQTTLSARRLTASTKDTATNAVSLQVIHGGKTQLQAVQNGRRLFTVVVERRLSDQSSAQMKLFALEPADVSDRQLGVGQAPTVPVKAYWFGRAINGKGAVEAAEHERHRTPSEIQGGMNARGESEVQVTFYEDQGVSDTGVEPGLAQRPTGEIQVTNEPVNSAHAQAFIAALNGQNGDQTYAPWPRTTVTLADGEKADVIADQFDGVGPTTTGFSVITSTTLVHVSGDIATSTISAMAAQLQPIR